MANPRRRRRVKRRAKRRGFFAANPKRRRRVRRRRGYALNKRRRWRRNPAPVKTIFTDIGYTAAGFMATKFVGNMVAPMLGGIGNQPLMRIGAKLGVAYLTAWGAEKMLGARWFMPVMIGGSLEVIQDVVRTYVAPSVPALAAAEYPLEMYYEAPLMLPPGGQMSEYSNSEIGTYMQM